MTQQNSRKEHLVVPGGTAESRSAKSAPGRAAGVVRTALWMKRVCWERYCNSSSQGERRKHLALFDRWNAVADSAAERDRAAIAKPTRAQA
jgi:hypothetical protein